MWYLFLKTPMYLFPATKTRKFMYDLLHIRNHGDAQRRDVDTRERGRIHVQRYHAAGRAPAHEEWRHDLLPTTRAYARAVLRGTYIEELA